MSNNDDFLNELQSNNFVFTDEKNEYDGFFIWFANIL